MASQAIIDFKALVNNLITTKTGKASVTRSGVNTVLDTLADIVDTKADGSAIDPNNITQDSTHRFATDTEKSTWNGKQNALGYTAENVTNKNVANGYAGLDGTGKVPASILPSYVDDVLEVANYAALPGTGETGKIYVTLDTNFEYRWSGSVYIQLVASPGSTDAVPEGTVNKYFTVARVLATILTGLNTATNSAITATDTILAALGKIQAQISAALTSIGANATAISNEAATRASADALLYPFAGGDLSAGAYVGLPSLSADPATPSAGLRMFYNSGLSWLGPNGYKRTFSGSGLTASRVWSLPDQAGTLELVLSVVTATTIGDANYTATVPAVLELGTITANRVLTLPTPSTTTGRVFRIINQNNNAFSWLFAANVVDIAGNTVSNLIGRRVYQLVSDGTYYVIQGEIQNETLITAIGTYTIANGVSVVRVNPSAALASLTINFPTTPGDRDRLSLYFGGTITSGLVVALLTLPTTILGALPLYAQAGNVYVYEYSTASGKWIAQNTSAVISQINAQAPDMTTILLESSAWGNISGKSGDFLQITGVNNASGGYGQVNQEYPLPDGIWCYCISATTTGVNDVIQWQRFRSRHQLDTSLFAALITVLTSTGTWDVNNTLATSTRSYVDAWYTAGTGYIYYCYAENSPGSGGTWYWRRIGAGVPSVTLAITSGDHPNLVTSLQAFDFTAGYYTEGTNSSDEASQQGQWFFDNTNSRSYVRDQFNKWRCIEESPRKHIVTIGTAPTIAAGAALGTSPTVAIVGTDTCHKVTITTGTSPLGSNGVLAVITFNKVFASAPRAFLLPHSANSAALSGTNEPYAAGEAVGTYTIYAGSAALAASTAYEFNVLIIQ